MNLIGRAIRKVFGGVLSPVPGRGGWMSLITEPFSGAWQRNLDISVDTVLSNSIVFACETLIAADIGKLRWKLMASDADDIWTEVQSASFSPVLRKPNRFQNHIQFKEWWITSKLCRGNTYALKQRDNRGIVVAMYLLDPCRVQVLVAPDGAVFYELQEDNLAGTRSVIVPASEIIHDRMNCLFHPLVGLSPIFACGISADQGLKIQRDSANFFANRSSPGGILVTPTRITDELAERMKREWDTNYGGDKAGGVAVLGDGVQFLPMRMSAADSQMIEQLRMTAELICSCFHVPAYMVGVGPAPLNNNVEALAQQYYSQCLQTLIESMEVCLDEGLGLDTPKEGVQMGVELDLDGLLRMDSSTQMATLKMGIDGGLLCPNEGRNKLNLKPLKGGDTVYLQQQQYSLAALDERDANDPFAKPTPAVPATPAAEPAPTQAQEDSAKALADALIAKFMKAPTYG